VLGRKEKKPLKNGAFFRPQVGSLRLFDLPADRLAHALPGTTVLTVQLIGDQ
jgi:hypothetical protein